ncbi:hypothetical protein CLTEP_18190 [Clostridium tepidiprofundi DSM 19306]|uniref:Uncharacterized protein n=1 Tax=Clostridium tepidiprofundi DSM 19306 TaxID=1121338 RepID=A0A151B2V1_9CLOT|nr:hypothetical protein CLTEP_18190 [Clostridium tepidiprofundi DSM 19306]
MKLISSKINVLIVLIIYPILYIIAGFFIKYKPPEYPPDVYGKGTMRTTSGYNTPTAKK